MTLSSSYLGIVPSLSPPLSLLETGDRATRLRGCQERQLDAAAAREADVAANNAAAAFRKTAAAAEKADEAAEKIAAAAESGCKPEAGGKSMRKENRCLGPA